MFLTKVRIAFSAAASPSLVVNVLANDLTADRAAISLVERETVLEKPLAATPNISVGSSNTSIPISLTRLPVSA